MKIALAQLNPIVGDIAGNAAKMADAAKILATEPMSLQLRYLQTLREIAAEKNSTTLFPIPIDLIKPFIRLAERMEKKVTGEVSMKDMLAEPEPIDKEKYRLTEKKEE